MQSCTYTVAEKFVSDDDMGESSLDKPLGELLRVFITVIRYYYIICNS